MTECGAADRRQTIPHSYPKAVPTVKGAEMSNRDFFVTYCVREDQCAYYRYAMADLASQMEDKPVWERREILDKWLNQPFDMRKWNAANDPQHRVPQSPHFDV